MIYPHTTTFPPKPLASKWSSQQFSSLTKTPPWHRSAAHRITRGHTTHTHIHIHTHIRTNTHTHAQTNAHYFGNVHHLLVIFVCIQYIFVYLWGILCQDINSVTNVVYLYRNVWLLIENVGYILYMHIN
jgi:hypothetical protein